MSITSFIDQNGIPQKYDYNSLDNIPEEPIIYPEVYGAVGDGIADDTSALQDMFDEIRAGTIIFNANSSYRITETIKIHSGYSTLTVLLGSILYDGPTDSSSVIELDNDTSGIDNKGRGGVKLIGGYVNANKKAGCGVRLRNCYHPVIEGVKIANYMQIGLDLGYPNISSPVSMQAMVNSCYIDNYGNDDVGVAIRCFHTDNNFSNIVTNRGFYAVELCHGGNFFSNCHFTLGVSSSSGTQSALYTFIHNAVSSSSERQTNSFSNCYFNGISIEYVVENDNHNLSTIVLNGCSLILGATTDIYTTYFRNHYYNPLCVNDLNVRHNANNAVKAYMFIGGNISVAQQARFTLNSGMLHTQENYDIVNMSDSLVAVINADDPLPANTIRRIARVCTTSGARAFGKIEIESKGLARATIYTSNDTYRYELHSVTDFESLKFFRSEDITEEVDGETIRYSDIFIYNSGNSAITSITYIRNDNDNWPYAQVWTHAGNDLDYVPTAEQLGDLTEISKIASTSKNLIKYPYSSESKTVGDLTFTVNQDGTVVANGTANSSTIFLLRGWSINNGALPVNPNVIYELSGSPEGASTSTYFLACRIYTDLEVPSSSSGQVLRDVGQGISFTGASYVSIYLAVINGQTVNNLVFKPMMTYAGLKNKEFSKYGEDITPYLINSITDKLDSNQGSSNAGKFMVVGNDGSIVPMAIDSFDSTDF